MAFLDSITQAQGGVVIYSVFSKMLTVTYILRK